MLWRSWLGNQVRHQLNHRVKWLGPRKPPRVQVPWEEVLLLDEGSSPSGGPIGKLCFRVKHESLDRFKNQPLEESGCNFTTFEALGAFIWRAKTAERIKKSKRQATNEYVHSLIDCQELNYGKRITAGRWVSGFTDWRHLGHSTVDFGWGGPVTVLPLSRNLLGSVEPRFFLSYSSVRGETKDGFKVLVTLPKIAMHGFKEEMGKLSSGI
ncbi:hypothetical protein Ancab_005318 [Ancistrocladus abbreviatus]